MTQMNSVEVTKTLVIGLGSTGTRVCNNLLRRLDWEYGDAKKASWVEFLAIETNNNEPSPLKKRGDFHTISLDARQYAQVLQSPQDYRKIHLENWVDMGTLKRLKDTEGGAGNIRMVGRLAFMLDPNFAHVRRALLDKLDQLRKLTPSDAFEQRGMLQDGSNPQIMFASGGEIRIFVVGTLCGGTASGILPDFGYFVRDVSDRESEKIIGIFTLPHEQLNTSIAANAEKLKKNAYTALVELNHYHQASAENMTEIAYLHGGPAKLTQQPYDLPYLVAPSSPTKEGERELNELVADRIFMNIVSPKADPFSRSVDAPMPDRDHQAHVFSTFGLSVVEFPAAQITEASAKKLLHNALDQWHRMKPERVSDLSSTIGLEWSQLVNALLQRDMAEWKSDALRAVNSEVEQGKPDFARIEKALSELRGKVDPNGALSNDLRVHREKVIDAIYQRFSDHAREALLDRTYGPQVLASEVRELVERLDDLHAAARENTAVAQSEAGEAWRKVEDGLRKLREEVKRKSLINLNRAGIDNAKSVLRKAIDEFASQQIYSSVHASIQTYHTHGTVDFGVAESLQRLLKIVQNNLNQLDSRVIALRGRLKNEYQAKDSEQSPVNGLVLFEPRVTVNDEFDSALKANRKRSVEHIDNVEASLHEEILRNWVDLPPVIVPSINNLGKTWIDQPFDPRGEYLLPQDTMRQLLQQAARPFSSILAQQNVIDRLHQDSQVKPNVEANVKDAATKAQPFLELNKAKATEGNRSPVMERLSVFLPTHSNPAAEDHFRKMIAGSFSPSNTDYYTSPDPTRALMLEEYFRFPLRGLEQVLGTHGLQSAVSRDFPTFHARRDVLWYGLSKREAQILERANEALVVSLILGEITVQNGLRFNWEPKGFGDRDFRLLPANLPKAAALLASGEIDQDGFDLTGALEVLESRIQAQWKRPDLSTEQAAEDLVERLRQRLSEFYRYGQQGQIAGMGDEVWAGEQLVKFTAKHTPLHNAYMQKYAPPQSRITSLTFRKDQAGPWGGLAPKDGLYCPQCGGLIGETVQDAAKNGWRCFANSTHYYGN